MNEASIELIQENTSFKVKTDVKTNVYLCIKRVFDFSMSLVSLIILAPIFLLIAILIKLDSKGNVIYKHKRIGKNGKYIYLYKFRTMHTNSKEILEEILKDPEIKKEWEENFKLSNDPRVTRVGKFLRRSSLDELPQLLNILIGNMSIVGPRPVVDGEIDKYGIYRNKLLSVTPGLTGWWACNGRSCTTYEERIKLELYYVDHKSILLDLKVIFKTFYTVIKGHGAK